MEFKTCEQYIISELVAYKAIAEMHEKEIKQQNETIKDAEIRIKELAEKVAYYEKVFGEIKERSSARQYAGGSVRYVTMKNVYEDDEYFNDICDALRITGEDFKNDL